MTFIITPAVTGWGDWQALAEKAKLKILPEQRALAKVLMSKNPCEKVEEERFNFYNPCHSAVPAEYYLNFWGMEKRFETLHPLVVLAAFASWVGEIPETFLNLVSTHILSDGEGRNFILLLEKDYKRNNILSFIPADKWVQRPVYTIGLTREAAEYHDPATHKRIN